MRICSTRLNGSEPKSTEGTDANADDEAADPKGEAADAGARGEERAWAAVAM